MSTSYIDIEELGRIKLFRRRGLKNIRISIDSLGEIRLSIPWYVSKSAGLKYLRTKKDWIKKHRGKINTKWTDGQLLFGDYTLSIQVLQRKNVTSTLDDTVFKVFVPHTHGPEEKHHAISRRVNKFLKDEAEKSLIPLAVKMAERSSFQPKEIRVKNMKSRWGSCNQAQIITLNASLLRLPENLAEYVIFHELVHTRHLNHSSLFWQDVEALLPDYKQRRKALKAFNSAGIF